jgi:hypothetical protein
LIREAALEPAKVLLDARKAQYTARVLGLPDTHPTAQLLPVTLRHGDAHAQPGEQPLDDREWALVVVVVVFFTLLERANHTCRYTGERCGPQARRSKWLHAATVAV